MKEKNETFWLARDNTYKRWYSLSVYKMKKLDGSYISAGNARCTPLHDTIIKLLGLPTLRKGQQVQLRRTPQGWEVVK